MFPVTRIPFIVTPAAPRCWPSPPSLAARRSEGDKLDYRSAGLAHAGPEVPPDLTQLVATRATGAARRRRERLQLQGRPRRRRAVGHHRGTGIDDLRIEREGNQRWLVTPLTPEQLWPRLQAF